MENQDKTIFQPRPQTVQVIPPLTLFRPSRNGAAPQPATALGYAVRADSPSPISAWGADKLRLHMKFARV